MKGQDLGRLVVDLLEHLRHLLLVQHMAEVPDSLPVTDETRERLREQANQLPAPVVLRLIDLLARRGRRHAPGRRPAPAARAGAGQGDPPLRRPVPRVTRLPPRAARERDARRLRRPGSRLAASRPRWSRCRRPRRRRSSKWAPRSSWSSCRRPGGARFCRPSRSARSRSARRCPRRIRPASSTTR